MISIQDAITENCTNLLIAKVKDFDLYLLHILQILADKTSLRINLENKRSHEDSGSAGKHVCKKCNKEFSSKSNLARHVDLHLGRFKFYCDQCKKGFSDSRDYKNHMNKHAGVMYRCTMCTKTFYNQTSRDYHMSAHTGVYRLTCNVCGQGFNEKRRLDKHISCKHFQ